VYMMLISSIIVFISTVFPNMKLSAKEKEL
jgi:hypothetical protein